MRSSIVILSFCSLLTLPNEVTAANTGGSPLLQSVAFRTARIAQFWRSAGMRFLGAIFVLYVAVVGCEPGANLGDLSRVGEVERDMAQSNWERTEKAFKARDDRTLEGLVGCKVLVLIDASGSPWTGKALSVEERAESAGDAKRLAGATGELASQIAREIRKRRDRAWQVGCKVDFTRKQVREHFIWPDAVFSAEFELLGTLTKASISGHSVWIKPVAIQRGGIQL